MAPSTAAVAPPPPPPPPQPDGKPAHDVVAGAMARAASQSTIHPLDTMKVRMQAGGRSATAGGGGTSSMAPSLPPRQTTPLERTLREVKGLYKVQSRLHRTWPEIVCIMWRCCMWTQQLPTEARHTRWCWSAPHTLRRHALQGVGGAATGAGIIIGTYFAFYSTTKRFLRQKTELSDGATAFTAGAAAALGSSVVKVPLAVCIRSVQAGVYKNVFHAASSIVAAAGVRGLFTVRFSVAALMDAVMHATSTCDWGSSQHRCLRATFCGPHCQGFLPTVLEDVPDMAVKFAVYETMRNVHSRLQHGRPANVAEDLIMGGVAGAAAAAATTPLDVLKTVMMCSASSRPTIVSAAAGIMREGKGLRPFFRGVGPRALSNGLNSAIFFCFFEAIRQVRAST